MRTEKHISKFHLELISTKTLSETDIGYRSKITNNCTKFDLINLMYLIAKHFSSIYVNNKAKRKNSLRKCVICAKTAKRNINVRPVVLNLF